MTNTVKPSQQQQDFDEFQSLACKFHARLNHMALILQNPVDRPTEPEIED